jgi:hypothetical protein
MPFGRCPLLVWFRVGDRWGAPPERLPHADPRQQVPFVLAHEAGLTRVVRAVRRLGEPDRPVERCDQERPLASLRDAVLLGTKAADGDVIAMNGEQAGEDRPQFQRRRHLLECDPPGPQRERPPQWLDDQQRSFVATRGGMLGPRVATGGELVRTGDDVRLVELAESLAGIRVRLARR